MLKRSLPAAALIVGLIAGLAWCAAPCCGSTRSGAPLSIGAVPCCGTDASDHCQASLMRADSIASSPSAPSLPPVAVLGHAVAASVPSFLPIPAVVARPALSRPDLARLAVPLLI
jgi:hypothetical protein